MKVGFLFPHPFSESLGSIRRVSGIATALKDKGAEPIILTPFERSKAFEGIRTEGIPNLFLKLGIGNYIYNMAKSMTYYRFFYKLAMRNIKRGMGDVLLKVLEKLEIDILQIEQEPTAIMVLPLLKRIKIPILLDFHGIWAEELIDSNILKRENEDYCILQDMVREATSAMDGMIVMSCQMKDYVTKEYAAEPSKIYVAELGADPFIKSVPERKGPVRIVYAGPLSRDKRADIFLDSIPYVAERNRNVEFHMTAKGSLLNEAYEIKKKHGVNVFNFWFSKQIDLLEFMSKCHLGILTLPNNLSYRINPAAKFFDYLSVGLPVVANDIGGWTRIIKEKELGILTDESPQGFAEGILRTIDEPEIARKCGERGLELLNKEYNLHAIADKLLNVYKRL